MRTITIELEAEVILSLALLAHEQDITLNQLITNILIEKLKDYENSKSNEDNISP